MVLLGEEMPPINSHKFISFNNISSVVRYCTLLYAILMRNQRIIIGNVVEGTY